MKKRKELLTIIIFVTIGVIVVMGAVCTLAWALWSQYDLRTGLSNYLCITVDKDQTREKIGDIGGYTLYIEGLNPEECYFTTFSADTVTLREAVERDQITLKGITRHAFATVKTDGAVVYRFDNYEIAVSGYDCIIRNKTGVLKLAGQSAARVVKSIGPERTRTGIAGAF